MAPATFPLQRPSAPALPRFLLALLPLLLGGCSGTPFGEALSRSFSGPSTNSTPTTSPPASASPAPRQGEALSNPDVPSTGPAETAGAQSQPKALPGAGPVAAAAGAGAAATSAVLPKPASTSPPSAGPSVPAGGASSASAQPPAPRTPANPAPYRVTIRLPQADPSAPAEVVTKALRAAGVPFEVETIERMGGGTPGAPAMAPGVPAAPQVRPAPPPR